MTRHVYPILTTLLDTDAYKFYMQQAVYHRYYDVPVTAEFCSRGDEMLGIYADDLCKNINAMQSLVLSYDEYHYLSSLPFFKNDYLNWLRQFRFDPSQVRVHNNNGRLKIQIRGPWREIILWEVPLLALISEVVHRHRTPQIGVDQAVKHLQHKLMDFYQQVDELDMSRFQIIDFGTRRRYSQSVQEGIVSMLKAEFPWLIGTSNYDLARRLQINPMGTQAHEWFQAHQQISLMLANSQHDALQSWLDEYNNQLGIALTDCINMDVFLRDFGPIFANCYQGLRHDSGDPVEWGEKAIKHYQRLNINPKSKTLVFSDNLNLNKALALYRHFGQRTNVVCGIGTCLTCDIPMITPLNIVIKLVKCNGKPVAKLSDNPSKTICQDKAFVNALYKAFDLPIMEKTD